MPYGYLKAKDDHQKWVVDEEAAAVVRRIFYMMLEGKGVYQVASILEKEKVLIPSAHWDAIGANNPHGKYTDPYRWWGDTVNKIVQNEEYTGKKILRKTYTDSYKLKKRKKTLEDERLVFENDHPAIVDEETWQNAQRLRRTVRRSGKKGEPPYRLTGLLYCADCGHKMTHMRTPYSYNGQKVDQYVCSHYRQYTRDCTMHYIRTVAVEALVLDAIRRVRKYAIEDEAAFVEKVRQQTSLRQEAEIREQRRQLTQGERRIVELDRLVKKLYEAYANDKIPEKHFEKLLAEYDTEQANLAETLERLQREIDTFEADSVKADKFLEVARRYTDFTELTTPMLNEFVEKIVVYEADKSSGERMQQVDIHFNFIGRLEVAEEPPTPEQLAEEDKKRKQRQRSREYMRRRREKQKAEEQEKKAKKQKKAA